MTAANAPMMPQLVQTTRTKGWHRHSITEPVYVYHCLTPRRDDEATKLGAMG
jgi:hypothetical protein